MGSRPFFRASSPGSILGANQEPATAQGFEKVKRVAEHVNLILRHIPYVQTNFVLGLDGESGAEPFELTKHFVDRAPGALPGYSLLSAFGEAAPINLEYQRDHRVIGFPFHFLNNHGAMNIKPKNYSWPDFYEHVIDLTKHSFSPRALMRRFAATNAIVPRWMNLVRAISSEGYGRIRYYSTILHRLQTDASFRRYFEQESETLPIVLRRSCPKGPWDHVGMAA